MPPTDEDIAWFKSTFRPIPKPALPDDCIEYSIFIISPEVDQSNDSESRLRLREVQKYANELQKTWLKGYIWQRQGFTLETNKEYGISFLRGSTEYGDSIEDEWVIVWLLREVTKRFNDVWVKVTDSDGEFLLIEASGIIPAWLEPEVAENRVWINDGQLKIIKPADADRSSKRTSEKLSLRDARGIIVNDKKRILHSTSIEEEAFYRLRNYPDQITKNMHHAIALIPRKLAFLLLQKQTYISAAIEAFYLRDPISLKPLQKKESNSELLFSPKDLVTISVKFPKVGYAQIKSQNFPVPVFWKSAMPSKLDSKEYARADIGMKLTSGFEMLVTDKQHRDKQAVREIRMLLEDLEAGDEHLPTDVELEQREKSEDDERWLDIDFHDLENELGGKRKVDSNGKKKEFGDKAAQENLQRIVKQFEDFLNNDKDGPDTNGIFRDDSDEELDSNDDDDDDADNAFDDDGGEDKDASFDEDEFTKMMQEMMGMPPEVMHEIMSGKLDGLSEDKIGRAPEDVRARAMSKVQEVDTSDEEDIMDMKQMEAELRASGALDMMPEQQQGASSTQKTITHKTAKGQSSDDRDHDAEDFDTDFARNIIQSFRSGGGMGGPAANLISMMNDQAEQSNKTEKKPQR